MDSGAPASELRKRVITGALGGILLIAVLILLGPVGGYLVALVMSLAMMYEFAGISLNLPDQAEKRWGLLLLTWITVVLCFLMAGEEASILAFCFLLLNFYFLLTAERYEGADFGQHYKELMACNFGVLYLVFLPLYLPMMQNLANGTKWALLFLIIVFAGDTAAYFGGKKWGNRRLYAKISPKKTVEGALAGWLAGVVCALLYKGIFFREMSWAATLVLPLVVGAAAQIGDLCESFLKRAFDKKDSGTILPGHGGFLDRFDGVVFSLPIMYACIKVLA
ncbi:MAG TPA: CDP-archaeol synthase [Bdellovibrionota bacterium]|nr:CDP-archaeol synthase [Bdellovibrionota bacterium]